MTIEEAISRLEDHTQYYVPIDDLEAFEMAVDALRARQASTKLDRSRRGCEWCGFYKSQQQLYSRRIMYCEKCGNPLTEESWAELERRISDG